MTKMIAALIVGLLFAAPVRAQNIPTSYNAGGVGVPNYTLQSGGSFYGQILNSVSSSQWSLGFGSSQSASGTSVLSWDSGGHVFLSGVAAPVVSSCGTNPSVATGSDNVGDLTIGSTGATTCTLTFRTAFTAIPHCFVNNRTSKVILLAQPTASTLVIVPSAGGLGTAADVIDYLCLGHAS